MFEDLVNIGLLCALMGLGVVVFIGMALLYVSSSAFMEDHFD